MVLDPDFVFLKAITIDELQRRFALSLHHPVAGNYGLGNRWVKWLKERDNNIKMKEIQSDKHYEAGVPVTNSMYLSIYFDVPYFIRFDTFCAFSNLDPFIDFIYFTDLNVLNATDCDSQYILHHEDWFKLIPEWISWISFVYDRYDGIESDMYAYMVASYQLGLQHTLSDDFQSTCMKSNDQKIHPFDDSNYFIHYCSANKIDVSDNSVLVKKWDLVDGMYVFNKHWTKARRDSRTKEKQLWLIECASPGLIEPPMIKRLEEYDESGDAEYRKEYKQYRVARRVVPMFNMALMDFKERHCENKSIINREKSVITHEATRDNGDLLYHIISRA